jgi:hypothetical protein
MWRAFQIAATAVHQAFPCKRSFKQDNGTVSRELFR